MLDRLRANPMTKKAVDRFAGSARVSSIWFKTASEYQMTLLLSCAYLFFVQILLGWFYSAIPEDTFAVFDELPESMGALFELFGGGDISSPAGWFQIETFGMMAPIMIMIVTIAIGSGAIAGEEAKRTMGLLLANPISRGRIIVEKTVTMVLYAMIVGIVAFAGTWLGALVGDMDLPWENIAAICVLLTLIGIAGGALALAIGAGTGRRGWAIWGAVGVAVVMHVLNALGNMGDVLADVQRFSPFYYYLGSDPLNSGLEWTDAAVLAAIGVVLVALSIPLFQRRDVREKD
jgi:ABC-2 type transport system permease protein